MNTVDAPTARALPKRNAKPVCFIVHTTGATDLPAVLKFYRADDGLCPHKVIDLAGTVYRIADENHVAWHCKVDDSEAALYKQGYGTWSEWVKKKEGLVHVGYEASNYFEWRDRWCDRFRSPLDLLSGAHPNYVSIGVELLQPVTPGVGIFTDAQYQALADVLLDSGERWGISLSRDTVLGHYDADPIARSTSGGGWDPGLIDWNRLWDLLKPAGRCVP
jgi:N-acetyl-anhydromuramyl-L-alanine amidase AmpD